MKIGFILDSIDNGTVVLPEFQRGYVWSRAQVRGLFQSLYRRYPVGGLLIWNTRADTTELRGDVSVPSGATVKLLLDGQQRVTSLYGVIRGQRPPFFEDEAKVKTFTGLHFHVGDETFEFHAPAKMAGDPLWISVSDLFAHGVSAVMKKIQDDVKDDLVESMARVQRLYEIRDVDLHDENISGDEMTVDVVVDIFNRVNSGGTKLSKGDLALARICAIRPEARAELREAIDVWETAGYHLKLDWFLRCINVVVTGEAKFEAMQAVSAEDFGLGLKKAQKAIDFILNMLSARLGLDHNRVLMGRYGIPAMVKVVVDSGGVLSDQQVQNDLLYWYVLQAAWGRYSGSTESVLDRDLQAIEEAGVAGLIAELEKSRGTLTVRPQDFDTSTVGSRFYPVLYMLTRVNDAQDFCSGLPLSAHLLGKGSRLEVHHVFPKWQLYQAGYSRSEVNAVANYAFLTGECNRKLGKTEPSEYFPQTEKSHPGALESQWIPEDQDLWAIDRYLDFLEDRRKRLADAANQILDGLRAGTETADLVASGAVGGDEDEADDALERIATRCTELGIAAPDLQAEVTDEESGEPLVYPDALWEDGLQTGMSEKVALLLETDEESESRLGELGYRFFTTEEAFWHYVEELLEMDLDGDGVVGAPGDD